MIRKISWTVHVHRREDGFLTHAVFLVRRQFIPRLTLTFESTRRVFTLLRTSMTTSTFIHIWKITRSEKFVNFPLISYVQCDSVSMPSPLHVFLFGANWYPLWQPQVKLPGVFVQVLLSLLLSQSCVFRLHSSMSGNRDNDKTVSKMNRRLRAMQ